VSSTEQQRYIEHSSRVRPAVNLGAIALIAMIQLSTLGDWTRFAIAAVGQAALFATNMLVDRLVNRFGSRGEVPRAAFNTITGSVVYHFIAWPLPVWFWLPFCALAFDEFGGVHTEAVVVVMCAVQGVAGTLDGVPIAVPLAFCGLTVVCRLLARRRVQSIRDMLGVAERQHRELERAHDSLKAEVAARERAELELRQAQKLEAIGRLAAGVAHEINTPMQFIGDSLTFVADGVGELLADQPADREYLRQHLPGALALASDGVRRVAAIVQSMKQFAHPGQDGTRAVDLNRAIRDTLTITRHEYKLVADIELALADVPVVHCNGGEINQVLLNLVVNAAQAIGLAVGSSGRRGVIRVTTTRDGDEVVIAVTDTGVGIPAEARARVFDPFFTTKPVGQGSGQGLAIARAAVERHGGAITFTSEVGRGTTFVVRLPIDSAPAAAA